MSGSSNITSILDSVRTGGEAATEQLFAVVYDELKRMAGGFMAQEGAPQTLQPTALVHEAYLRLLGPDDVQWDSRGHFFTAAATAMRRILVDRARSRGRLKRGGDRARVPLPDSGLLEEPPPDELLDLDEAIDRLQAYDARKAQVVTLRFFAGLTVDEAAAALQVSPATIKNDWAYARAWLHRELAESDGDGAGEADHGQDDS